jgi:hypothetical protein
VSKSKRKSSPRLSHRDVARSLGRRQARETRAATTKKVLHDFMETSDVSATALAEFLGVARQTFDCWRDSNSNKCIPAHDLSKLDSAVPGVKCAVEDALSKLEPKPAPVAGTLQATLGDILRRSSSSTDETNQAIAKGLGLASGSPVAPSVKHAAMRECREAITAHEAVRASLLRFMDVLDHLEVIQPPAVVHPAQVALRSAR